MKISLIRFIFLFTIFNTIIYHLPFYQYAIEHLSIESVNGLLTLFSLTVALLTVTLFILFIIATILPSIIKAFLIIITLTNSIALYFMLTYHVILDKSMMGNLFNTNLSETLNLYEPTIILYLFFLGIIPAILISKIEIRRDNRFKLLFTGITTLLMGILLMYLNSTTWLWLDKNAKILGGLSMPWSYSINSVRYKLHEFQKSTKETPLPSATLKNSNEMIVVLIIGESSRASNWSLYGYDKKTNPLLEKENSIVVLNNSYSTATYTTASVHAILSSKGSTSDNYETLPNYLQRTGVNVIWRTKNWGQPTLHIDTFMEAKELKKECQGEGCDYDEVLLTNFEDMILKHKDKKLLVVLHTSGSHGPTYYKKYPKSFEKFKPICRSVDLKSCTQEELDNAYNNTIVYTDYIIDMTIKKLRKLHKKSVLIYLSDHGESLGEYGLYLHGTPYSIAPDVQKKIPFIVWQSPEYMSSKGLKKPYIKHQDRYGQFNIFHTILALFDVNSSIYQKNLDIFN